MIRASACLFAICLFLESALAQSPTAFKVGAILPLTGGLTEYGVAAKNGIELARKEHPELFNSIEFIYEDSQYDMNKTVSAFRKLQSRHDIALTFVWGSNPSNAVAAIAESVKEPLIAYTTERNLGAGKEYVIRFCSHEEQHARAILEYLRSKGLKHFTVLKTEIVFFNGITRDMRKLLQNDETIQVHDVALGEQDFKTLITKVTTEKVDGLVALLVSGQISTLYRQLEQLKVKFETVGTDFFDSMTEVRQAGGTMTGAVFPAHYVDQAFVGRYTAEYGNDVQLAIAAIAHDFALIVGRSFGNIGREQLKAEDVVRKFKHTRKEAGYATEFNFDDAVNGFDFRLIMRRVEKDRIVDLVK